MGRGTYVRGLAGSVRDAEPKSYEVIKILAHYNIDLAALTETKHRDGSYEEEYEVSGTVYKVLFAGFDNGERNHHGVALAVRAELWTDWGGQWEPISNRIISGWLKNGRETILVVGAYSPTEDSDDCAKDDFYDGLQRILSRANVNQKVILLGDSMPT